MRKSTHSPVRLLAALLATLTTAAAQDNPYTPTPPDQVPASDLADYHKPLEATVTLRAATATVAPRHSFTSGTGGYGDINALNYYHGGFEPMSFRPKFRVAEAHDSRVILRPDDFLAVPQGFFDGARVRVYQAVDGQIVKIRDSKVKPAGHAASGWMEYRGALNTLADSPSYEIALDSSFQNNRDYWFTVKTVDAFRRVSEPADPVSLHVTTAADSQSMAQKNPNFRDFKDPARAEGGPPQAPANLTLTDRGETVSLSWDPVESPDVVGYNVLVTAYPPAEHRGFHLDLESREPRPDRAIQARDIVFVDQFKRTFTAADRAPFAAWPAYRGGYDSPFKAIKIKGVRPNIWSDGAEYPMTWEFADHPRPLPADMAAAGRSCLELSTATADPVGVILTMHGGTDQAWYDVIEPGEHTVEAWVRGTGTLQLVFTGPYAPSSGDLPFGQSPNRDPSMAIPPVNLPLTDEWTKVTGSFTVPKLYEQGLGQMMLSYSGPGTAHIDNVRVFRSDHPYGQFHPLTLDRLRESDMRYMRTHELIKTGLGYTLDGMTNHAGAINYAGARPKNHTFFSLLENIRRAGNLSPWLQVEMCLSEEEWLGFAEWLLAPYDPDAGDTPESKPWAHKRWSMGQKEPWIDAFPEFAFEISNETWNRTFAPYDWDWGTPLTDSVTGQNYSYGETYGLFNEYVVNQLRKSPYWTEATDEKIDVMLCGWQAAPAFGGGAAIMSPSADELTYAGYISTSGLGDPTVANDYKRFNIMQWSQIAITPQAKANRATDTEMRRRGRLIDSGVYEYGYGFTVGPGQQEKKEVDQQLSRSMVGAVAVTDAALTRFSAGLKDLAFFTFEHELGSWGSHNPVHLGGWPYPYWKALTLYNRHGTGRFLETTISSAPTWDFKEYKAEDNMHMVTRKAMPDAPMVSLHASTEGDRLTIFLVSRKLDDFPIAGDDGFTPVTLQLPVKDARKITLHRLTADPRVDDRFNEHVQVETIEVPADRFNGTLPVNETTGGSARGLPPASIYMYVLEGVDTTALTVPPVAFLEKPGTIVAGEPFQPSNQSILTNARPTSVTWTADAAEPTGDSPEITFTQGGFSRLGLTITDSNDRSDSLIIPELPVAVRFMDTLWHPAGQRPGQGKQIQARVTENGALTLTSEATLTPSGFLPVFSADPLLGKDFRIEATVEAIEAAGDHPNIAGGLILTTQPRAGLGFNWDQYKTRDTICSLLISPDGALRAPAQGSANLIEVLPPGSVTLPAKIRISVENGVADMAVLATGIWQSIGKAPVPTDTGVYPGLAASAQGGPTSLRVSEARVTTND